MLAKFETTINFTPDEVKNILKDYVRKELGLIVDDVTFSLTTQYHGFGPSESSEKVFSGAKLTAKVGKPESTNHTNSLAAQIAAVEGDPRQYGDH